MRRRLIAALVGVALGTLLLYAGPRAFMIADMIREREEIGLDRTAGLVAEAIDQRLDAGLAVEEVHLSGLLVGRDDCRSRWRRPTGPCCGPAPSTIEPPANGGRWSTAGPSRWPSPPEP